MRKAWGSHGRWAGIVHGTVTRITDDDLLLSFTVRENGADKTVTMRKSEARITITEDCVTITEVPHA